MNPSRALLTAACFTLGLASLASAGYVTEAGHAPYYTTIPEGMEAAKKNNAALAIKYYTEW